MLYKRSALCLAAAAVLGCLSAWGHPQAAVILLGMLVFQFARGGRCLRTAVLLTACFGLFLLLFWRAKVCQTSFEGIQHTWAAGDEGEFTGRITACRSQEEQTRFVIRLEAPASLSGERVIVYTGEEAEGNCGDKVTFFGTILTRAGASNEGMFDAEAYDRSNGIMLRVSADEWQEISSGKQTLTAFFDRLRLGMEAVYARALPGEEGGLLAALCLGRSAGESTAGIALLQEAGLAHLTAVSGTHVGIVGRRLYRFLRRRGMSFAVSSICAGALLTAYVCLCGGSVSAIRAAGMFFFFLWAQCRGLSYDGASAAALCMILLLALRPEYLFSSGFQMSFAAAFVFSLGDALRTLRRRPAFRPTAQRRDRSHLTGGENMKTAHAELWETVFARLASDVCGLPLRVADALKSGLLIQAGLLPLMLRTYYTVSLVSVPLNLVAMPFLPLLLGLGLGGGLLGCLLPSGWSAGGRLTGLLLLPCHGMLFGLEAAADAAARFPLASWCAGSAGWIAAAVYWGFFFWGLSEAGRKKPKTQIPVQRILEGEAGKSRRKAPDFLFEGDAPGGQHTVRSCLRRPAAERGFISACWLLSLTFLLFHNKIPRADFVMLDVGQGTGIFLEDGRGGVYMIDGGSTSVNGVGARVIEPFLRYHGHTRVDVWFCSHTDSDHVSGLLELLEDGFEIALLVLPDALDRMDEDVVLRLQTLAAQNKTRLAVMRPQDRILMRDQSGGFLCLFPDEESGLAGANDCSLVLRIVWEDRVIFFGGDISSEAEQKLLMSGAFSRFSGGTDLYLSNHHGSNGSGSDALLDALRPAAALISCGRNNRYGHPGAEATGRLDARKIPWHVTAEAGQLRMVSTPRGFYIEPFLREW